MKRLILTIVPVAVVLMGALYVRAGFLTPNSPIPAVGVEGGPGRALSSAEAAMFQRGRLLFDAEVTLAKGLGTPEINGDSCRACHFEPAIGGAGRRHAAEARAEFEAAWKGADRPVTSSCLCLPDA